MKIVLQALTSLVLCVSFTLPAVRLDGILSPGEWKDAKEADLQGGGKLYFMKEGNVLYVALKGVSRG